MNGDRLEIQASVDLAGLKKLKDILTKYESRLRIPAAIRALPGVVIRSLPAKSAIGKQAVFNNRVHWARTRDGPIPDSS
jgi:hypothetical protein